MNLHIHFTKMHGLGNDFIILDGVSQFIPIHRKIIRQIAHRRFGIGCDQVLVIEPPTQPQFDFLYRIFNADGREVAQCGNGARCVARYLKESGLLYKSDVYLETLSRPLRAFWDSYGQITVDLGIPLLEPQEVPIVANRTYPHRYELNLFHENRVVYALSLGNPHCVIPTTDIKQAPVDKVGRLLQKHPAFPEGVNVGFCETLARNHIKLRVFERGCGETYACGSGAAAAVVAGILNKELSEEVRVDLASGSLTVRWQGLGAPVLLSGPTQMVYRGEFTLAKTPPHSA